MIRIANNKARDFVARREEFQGSNMFGSWLDREGEKLYIVYSYGSHFPMYIYDNDANEWIANSDKYSRSTTRHQSQARPLSSGTDLYWLNTSEMLGVIRAKSLTEFSLNRENYNG